MLRIALTASLLALALPAYAQAPAPAPAPATAPIVPVAPSELEQSGLTPPTVVSQGYATSVQDVLVTQLLGQTVYTSVDDDAQEVGAINDMVVTAGQGISAVVIGVGGLLGMGEKDVAVDFAQLEWATREDGSRRWVLAATPQSLVDAPAFIWGESEAVTGQPAMTPEQEEQQLVDGDPNAAPIDPELTTDQPERPLITTPVDRSDFTPFDEEGLTPDQLRGIGVYGVNDEQIGTIGDIITNADGSFDAVVVDVGGFLGIGAKPVAVGFDNLVFSSDTFGNRYLFLNTSRDQLETQAAYDPATYDAERASQRMVILP